MMNAGGGFTKITRVKKRQEGMRARLKHRRTASMNGNSSDFVIFVYHTLRLKHFTLCLPCEASMKNMAELKMQEDMKRKLLNPHYLENEGNSA